MIAFAKREKNALIKFPLVKQGEQEDRRAKQNRVCTQRTSSWPMHVLRVKVHGTFKHL
jgi:hypothetical protein